MGRGVTNPVEGELAESINVDRIFVGNGDDVVISLYVALIKLETVPAEGVVVDELFGLLEKASVKIQGGKDIFFLKKKSKHHS